MYRMLLCSRLLNSMWLPLTFYFGALTPEIPRQLRSWSISWCVVDIAEVTIKGNALQWQCILKFELLGLRCITWRGYVRRHEFIPLAMSCWYLRLRTTSFLISGEINHQRHFTTHPICPSFVHPPIRFYTVSQKTSPTFLAVTRESIVGFV